MRRLGLQGEDLLDGYRTLRRNIPTAFVVVMLAGIALPAEAKNANDGSPEPAVALAEDVPAVDPAAQPAVAPTVEPDAEKSKQDAAPAEQPPEDLDGDGTKEAAEVEAPQVPGKNEDADEADPADPGKGKSAVEVPAAKSKGKSGSAPEPAQPAIPPARPATPPASDPGVTLPGAPPVPRAAAGRQQETDAVGQPGTPRRDTAGTGTGAGTGVTAATLPVVTPSPASAAAPEADRGGDSSREGDTGGAAAPESDESVVTRTVRDVVEVVPDELKAALALLAAIAVLLGGGYVLAALRARRLDRQRRELMQEVGLLQSALLPPVPEKVGAVRASVAYRPSDGPGAGGDFYDALTLPGGRGAFILGDVSGHGRAALAHTAFMRYTLRAYLEAGLGPRLALQVAERAVGGQLDGDFATVIVAVHDPSNGSLTYASAGHPAPIIAGGARHEPVLAAWSPPIGWGLPTGLRQTTVPLPSGAIACLYTDGLAEATTADGILGRARLSEIVGEAGRHATA